MPRATKEPAPPEILPPEGFEIRRATPLGRHPLLEVFPGMARLPLAKKVEAKAPLRKRLFEGTSVEVVAADLWAYVAPQELPPNFRRRRWSPVVTPGADCIVLGRTHLRTSPALVLYMDIYHELTHVRQRRNGANLWEPGLSYVERETEIEAYRIVVEEARRLGASDAFLREYLEVEWVTAREHRQLLATLSVPES